MKQELIYFKKILSQNVAVVFTCLLMSNSSYAEERHVPIDFPMPGSACQAYDEAALSSGELIRTTIGIKNSGKKDINIYCPVKTAIDSILHRFTISSHSENSGSPLNCFVAFNAFQLRKYKKLQNTKGSGYYSTTVKTERFGWHPVTIKCTLKPGHSIRHIMTWIDRK